MNHRHTDADDSGRVRKSNKLSAKGKRDATAQQVLDLKAENQRLKNEIKVLRMTMMQKDMSIRESEQPVSELKRLSHTSEIEKGGLMTEQENTESNVGLDRAEVTAAIQRSIEVTAGQAGMMQAIHPLTGQDQLSVHESMYGDIYPATTQLFDAAIQAHYRLPPHHRTASMTLLYAADILIFAFGVPIKETEQAVQHPDL